MLKMVGFRTSRLDAAKKRASSHCKLQGLIFLGCVIYNTKWSFFSRRLHESDTFFTESRPENKGKVKGSKRKVRQVKGNERESKGKVNGM